MKIGKKTSGHREFHRYSDDFCLLVERSELRTSLNGTVVPGIAFSHT
jgi:hypothetical protein